MNETLAYLSYLKNTKKYLILAYILVTVFLFIVVGQASLGFVVINILCLILFLGKPGQKLMALILNGKKISRKEDREYLEAPIRALINQLRGVGLNLSDDIDIYTCQTDQVFAYAIGRNTLVLSSTMTELKEANEDIFTAKIINELYRMHTYDSNNILAIIGCNFLTTIVALLTLGAAFIEAKVGRKYTSLFFNRNEQMEGTIIFIVVSLALLAWAGISYLIIKNDIRKTIVESDEFLMKLDMGDEMCAYLDNFTKNLEGYKFKIFEIGNPNPDERIGFLQDMGAAYYR